MKIAFIKPNYPGEKRVAILPDDIASLQDSIYQEIIVERGFGEFMGLDDNAYRTVGCTIMDRAECFAQQTIFSLKLIQPVDYPLLKQGGNIIGWMHPGGSGKTFTQSIAREKQMAIFDVDSVYPKLYWPDGSTEAVDNLPPHFFWKNSYLAGIAATKLAFQHYRLDQVKQPLSVCVLGSGSVSQGAFYYLSSLGIQPRMFYRKTLPLFYGSLSDYDVVVNGIEVDIDGHHILTRQQVAAMKPDAILVEAAADAGRAIEGTRYHSLENPAGMVEGRRYTLVNNAPTLMFEEASRNISRVVSDLFLRRDFFLK